MLAVCIGGLSADARAQQPEVAQVLPPSAEPGRIEQRFETPSAPRVTEEPIVEETDGGEPPAGAADIRFVLMGVVVEGATVYAGVDLEPLYGELIGREISVAEVFQIAARITARYRNDGYILSRAIVPPQRIRAGVARLQVIEGFIDEVVIEGEAETRLLRSYADKIAASRPLNIRELERYLLLMDELPGVTARSVLRPSAHQPGASQLVVVLDQQNVAGFASIDNRGSRFVGANQITAGTRLYSLLGLHESTTLRAITTSQTEELRLVEGVHTQQIGAEGTTAGLFASYYRSEPGFTLGRLDVESHNLTLRGVVRHSFIRSRTRNLSTAVSFTYRNIDTDSLGSVLSEDRERVLRLSAEYDFIDRLRGVSLVSATVSQGLDILGASEDGDANLSRARGFGQFTKVSGEASRLQDLGALISGLSVVAGVTGQYSAHNLLSSEEFGVGGAQYGRAYDPSEITGEHGAAAKAELQYGGSLGLIDSYQLYTYYDFGVVWNSDAGPGTDSRQSLAAAGVGVRFNVTERVSGSLEAALPLTRPVAARGADGNDARGFFSLAVRF